MATQPTQNMADEERRALLTEDEDAILRGEKDVSEKYYYVVVSRVRKKIDKLVEDDMETLAEHDTLADELRNGVCRDDDHDE